MYRCAVLVMSLTSMRHPPHVILPLPRSSLYLYLFQSLSVCTYIYHLRTLSPSHYLSLSLPNTIFLSLSLCLTLSHSLTYSLCLTLSLSHTLSPFTLGLHFTPAFGPYSRRVQHSSGSYQSVHGWSRSVTVSVSVRKLISLIPIDTLITF